jgi:multidrug efflux pump subunit AcrA (membrane-fusion protein)
MKAERVTIVLVLLLFLGSCSKEKKTSEETTVPPVIRDIQVALVRPETVVDSFESVGTVTPGNSTMLSSKTVGTIVLVLAKEGDRVKQGQTLIEIDARDSGPSSNAQAAPTATAPGPPGRPSLRPEARFVTPLQAL